MKTLDSFNDWRKPHMARGNFMLGGLAVVVSPNLPRKHIADEIVPVYWPWPLRLWLKHPRRYRRGVKIERDQAFIIGDKVFMSPDTARKAYRIDL